MTGFNPLTKQIIIVSKDVDFDEEDYWTWIEKEWHVRGMLVDSEYDGL